LGDDQLLKNHLNQVDQEGYTPLLSLINKHPLGAIQEIVQLLGECEASLFPEKAKYNALFAAIYCMEQPQDLDFIHILLKFQDISEKIHQVCEFQSPILDDIKVEKEWSIPLAKLLIDHGALKVKNQLKGYPEIFSIPEIEDYYLAKHPEHV
jgi:hypothetical protein